MSITLLQLGETSYISQLYKSVFFDDWLPIKERYNQNVNSITLKYFETSAPVI